jgi:hypothetical protein
VASTGAGRAGVAGRAGAVDVCLVTGMGSGVGGWLAAGLRPAMVEYLCYLGWGGAARGCRSRATGGWRSATGTRRPAFAGSRSPDARAGNRGHPPGPAAHGSRRPPARREDRQGRGRRAGIGEAGAARTRAGRAGVAPMRVGRAGVAQMRAGRVAEPGMRARRVAPLAVRPLARRRRGPGAGRAPARRPRPGCRYPACAGTIPPGAPRQATRPPRPGVPHRRARREGSPGPGLTRRNDRERSGPGARTTVARSGPARPDQGCPQAAALRRPQGLGNDSHSSDRSEYPS